MTKVQIIANPAAGNHDPKIVAALSDAFVAQGAEALITPAGPGLPIVLSDAVDIVCVVGGDGSVRHGAQAIVESKRDIALSAWPGGTINLFQREVAKAKTPEGFARETLTRAYATAHYAAVAGETLFLGCLSIGPDAHAVAAVSLRLKRLIGRMAYGVALAKLLVRWPRPKLRLRIGEVSHDCEAIYIANGTYFAGPWSFAPAARRTEPCFHIVALRNAGRVSFLAFMMRVMFSRTMEGHSNYIVAAAGSCHIGSDAPCPVQIDGDVEGRLPMTVAIVHPPLAIV
jgi:diacylglycerol kinase (ATP)